MTSSYRPEAIPTPLDQDQWYLLIHTRISEYLASNIQGQVGDEFTRAVARAAAKQDERDYFRSRRTLLAHADYATPAATKVKFRFSVANVNAYTIKAGTPIMRTAYGLRYVLLEDMVRGAGAASDVQELSVACMWDGIEGNAPAFDAARQAAAKFYSMDPDPDGPTGHIDYTGDINEFMDQIRFGTLSVESAQAFEGGSDGEAHGIGLDVGMTPEQGEGIGFFRARIAAMAHQVTYSEVLEGVNLILAGYGTSAEITHSMIAAEEWGGDTGFAWGVAPWGSYFIYVIIVRIPAGMPTENEEGLLRVIQNYVDAVTAAGYRGLVMPYDVPSSFWGQSMPFAAAGQYGFAGQITYGDEVWVSVWAKADVAQAGIVFRLQENAGTQYIEVVQDGTEVYIHTLDPQGNLLASSAPVKARAGFWHLYVLRKKPAHSGLELYVKEGTPLAPFRSQGIGYAPLLLGVVDLYLAAEGPAGAQLHNGLVVGQVNVGGVLTLDDFQRFTTLDNKPKSLVDMADPKHEWNLENGADSGADFLVTDPEDAKLLTLFNRLDANLITDEP